MTIKVNIAEFCHEAKKHVDCVNRRLENCTEVQEYGPALGRFECILSATWERLRRRRILHFGENLLSYENIFLSKAHFCKCFCMMNLFRRMENEFCLLFEVIIAYSSSRVIFCVYLLDSLNETVLFKKNELNIDALVETERIDLYSMP